MIDSQLHADPPPAVVSGDARRVVGAVRRTPFTTGLLATLWRLGAWTQSLMAGPSPGLRVGVGLVALGEGRWWTLASSLWWCPDLPTYVVVLGELETTFTPIRPAATVLYDWTGVVFWAVALAATGWLLRRSAVPAGDAAAARALLTRTGGSSLAWSTT